jgi:hypothetical protein
MKRNGHTKKIIRLWTFLASVFTLYIILFSISSARVVTALKMSGSILVQIAGPLLIAFIVMILLNFLSGHEKISRFFGRSQGIKGIAFSSLAGILSMGPVYAWYPLLKVSGKKMSQISIWRIFFQTVPLNLSFFL